MLMFDKYELKTRIVTISEELPWATVHDSIDWIKDLGEAYGAFKEFSDAASTAEMTGPGMAYVEVQLYHHYRHLLDSGLRLVTSFRRTIKYTPPRPTQSELDPLELRMRE